MATILECRNNLATASFQPGCVCPRLWWPSYGCADRPRDPGAVTGTQDGPGCHRRVTCVGRAGEQGRGLGHRLSWPEAFAAQPVVACHGVGVLFAEPFLGF